MNTGSSNASSDDCDEGNEGGGDSDADRARQTRHLLSLNSGAEEGTACKREKVFFLSRSAAIDTNSIHPIFQMETATLSSC
jgi:hypothetical protein